MILAAAVIWYLYYYKFIKGAGTAGSDSSTGGGEREFDIDSVGNNNDNHTNTNPMRAPAASRAPTVRPADGLGAGLGLDDDDSFDVRSSRGVNVTPKQTNKTNRAGNKGGNNTPIDPHNRPLSPTGVAGEVGPGAFLCRADVARIRLTRLSCSAQGGIYAFIVCFSLCVALRSHVHFLTTTPSPHTKHHTGTSVTSPVHAFAAKSANAKSGQQQQRQSQSKSSSNSTGNSGSSSKGKMDTKFSPKIAPRATTPTTSASRRTSDSQKTPSGSSSQRDSKGQDKEKDKEEKKEKESQSPSRFRQWLNTDDDSGRDSTSRDSNSKYLDSEAPSTGPTGSEGEKGDESKSKSKSAGTSTKAGAPLPAPASGVGGSESSNQDQKDNKNSINSNNSKYGKDRRKSNSTPTPSAFSSTKAGTPLPPAAEGVGGREVAQNGTKGPKNEEEGTPKKEKTKFKSESKAETERGGSDTDSGEVPKEAPRTPIPKDLSSSQEESRSRRHSVRKLKDDIEDEVHRRSSVSGVRYVYNMCV